MQIHQLFPVFKIYWTVHLQWVNFMLQKLYLNKPVFSFEKMFLSYWKSEKLSFVLIGQTGDFPLSLLPTPAQITISQGCCACNCGIFSSLRLHSRQAYAVKICVWSDAPVFCYPLMNTTGAVFSGCLTNHMQGGHGNRSFLLPSWAAYQEGSQSPPTSFLISVRNLK